MSYSILYSRLYDFTNNVKNAFHLVFQLSAVKVYSFLFIFWQAVLWTQAIIIANNLSGQIIALHYNVDFGIDLIAEKSAVFWYPSLAATVFLVNLIFLMFLRENKQIRVFGHYLLGAASFFSFIISLVLLSIYLINFR